MSHFSVAIEELVTRIIRDKLILLDDRVHLDVFYETERRERELLAQLIRDGWVRPDNLEEAVKDALARLAWVMLRVQMEKLGKAPDHVDSPPALAYGIQTGVFVPIQIQWFERQLDHGETLEEFKRRSDGLLGSCLEQLKSGPPERTTWPTGDVGTICLSCGH